MAGDAANLVLGPIIEKTITPMVDAIGRQLGYLFCYKSNIKNLEERVNQLEKSRNDADRFFKEQIRNNEETAESSKGWQGEVEKVIKDAKEVEEAATKLKGCLNLKGRYVQSRKSTKLVVKIQTLHNKAPEGITTNIILPAGSLTGAQANNYSEGYKTRMQTMDEVMKALEDPAISVIGLCGLGGVGKTTMVHEVRERAREQNLFDEVAMTTVSQNQDLFKIQGDLAEMLGLTSLKEETNIIGRADHLRKRLTGGNKVLIILDDVWSDIKLADVGIPFGSGETKCKVVITSRHTRVCANTQKNIEVRVLAIDEARALFRKTAGECVEMNNLEKIADEIADECRGLPIALLTLSRALSNYKDSRAWEDARARLREGSSISIPGMEKEVYQSIKLSYDFLATEKQEEAQSLLLLCCQHQEDVEIKVEMLARYCLSLELFEGVTGVVHARNRVYRLIEQLKSCFLLQAVGAADDEDIEWRDEAVKVHDVVRDVCLSMVSRHEADRDRVYMHIMEKEIDDSDKIGTAEEIDDADKIGTSEVDHPKIKLLMIPRGAPLHPTPSRQQMEELRVLDILSREDFGPGPYLFQFPTNLRMLSLGGVLVHPHIASELSMLTELEVLSFYGSRIDSFPCIGELRNLKLLDLRLGFGMGPIPSGILPGLTKLEVLYMGSYHFGDKNYTGLRETAACISELDSLRNLTTLQIFLSNPMELLELKHLSFEKLKKFHFCTDKWYDFSSGSLCPLVLKTLHMKKVGIEWVFGDKIQSIIETTVHLHLEYIADWIDPLIMERFASLRKLYIISCHKLEYIFPHSAAKCLVHLQKITVKNCVELKGFMSKRGEETTTGIETNIRKKTNKLLIHFPMLRKVTIEDSVDFRGFYNLEDGRGQPLFNPLVMLPSIEELHVSELHQLKQIAGGFPTLAAANWLQNLNILKVYDCESLESVFDFEGQQVTGEENTHVVTLTNLKYLVLKLLPNLTHLCRQVPKEVHSIFQNLMTLEVVDCGSLAYLIPSSIAHMLVNLQELDVWGCKGMKEVVYNMNEEDNSELEKKVVFRSLTSVELVDLENLLSFCSSDQQVFEFPSLETVSIMECPRIETFCCQVPSVAYSRMSGGNVSKGEGTSISGGGEIKKVPLPTDQVAQFPKLKKVILETFCCQIPSVAYSRMSGGNVSKGERTSIAGGREIKKVPDDLVAQFPKLKEVILRGIPKFRGFYNTDNDNGRLLPLCMLPSIEKLDVSGLHQPKQIAGGKMPGFPTLAAANWLQNLKYLNVYFCKSLESVFDFEGQVPKEVNIFQNLTILRVVDCGSLAYLIPSSIAHMLVNLQELDVRGCKGMKEVVYNMNEEDYSELEKKVVFRSLRSVRLVDLENLLSFCSSDQQVFEFPSLEKLSIIRCPGIETFCCQIPSVAYSRMSGGNVSKGEGTSIAGGGEIKKVPDDLVAQFPKLKEVILIDTAKFRGFYNIDNDNGRPLPLCHTLVMLPTMEKLEVYNLHQLKQIVGGRMPDIPSFGASDWQSNLQRLVVRDCDSLESVFDFEGEQIMGGNVHVVTLGKLQSVALMNLPNLTHIFRSGLHGVSKEVNGFQNLRRLFVDGCDSLSYLLTSTMAHMLVNLKTLVVSKCKSLKEVVKMTEDCGENKIVLLSLRHLELDSLEKLSSFCSAMLHEFGFPSLDQLMISKCPVMKTFCCGHVTAEKLQGVYFDNSSLTHEDNDGGDDDDHRDLRRLRLYFYNYVGDDGDGDGYKVGGKVVWKSNVNETIRHFNARVKQMKSDLKEDGVDDDGTDDVDKDNEEELDGNDVGDKPLSLTDLNETAQQLNARVTQISCHLGEDDVGDKRGEDAYDIHVPGKGVDNQYDQCSNKGTSSKPMKALLAELIVPSQDALLAPVIVSPSPSVAENSESDLNEDRIVDSDADEAEVFDYNHDDEDGAVANHVDSSDAVDEHVNDPDISEERDHDQNVQHDNEDTSCTLTKAVSAPLVGSFPSASLAQVIVSPSPLVSDNNEELAYSSSVDLQKVVLPHVIQIVPSSDSPVRHFNPSDLKEDDIDDSAADDDDGDVAIDVDGSDAVAKDVDDPNVSEDVNDDENAQYGNEAFDHSGTSCSTSLNQATSKPTKDLLASAAGSSPAASLAPTIVSLSSPASDNNEEFAHSSTPDLENFALPGLTEIVPLASSGQSVPSSDYPAQTNAGKTLSNPSLSSSDADWTRSRILIRGVYIKAVMKTTFEEILTANPNFLSGLRFKKAEIKTVFVESAISSLQCLRQYTARTMHEEQLTSIKEFLDDLAPSGLDITWLERGYQRASLVMKEKKAVLAATELARLEKKKVEAEAAFEMAKAKLEEVMSQRDASKAECDDLLEEVEAGKEVFGGGFDQEASLGDGLLN